MQPIDGDVDEHRTEKMTHLNKALAITFLASLAVSAAPAVTLAAIDSEAALPRLSTSTIQGVTTKNQYPPNPAKQTESNTRKRTIQNHDYGLWIYDVVINLDSDNDADGHYSTFTVSLDIDTNFSPSTIYAVFYLRQNGGQWLEYAVTNNFTVSGSGSADSIIVETNLESGYAGGYYDHYIEVYDAYDHSLLISQGPNQNNHLQGLPFESYYDDSYYSPVTVSLTFSGTGSVSIFGLGGIFILLGCRRYRIKNTRVELPSVVNPPTR